VSASALIESKRREIDARLHSLTAEFEYWRQRSAERGALEKHHSQIRGITSQLQGLRDRLCDDFAEQLSPLEAGQEVERNVLELFRIWEFFRSKLAQREIQPLRDYLDPADELAWQCYVPFRDAARAAGRIKEGHLREPPLVFLNGGSSPFAAPRHSQYDAEDVPGEALSQEAFRKVLRSLPIPLVGVPWFQVAHLPDVLVIAHEIGHHVEDDLGLTETLLSRIDKCLKDKERRTTWRRWMGETFADIFGAVALGRSFVRTMMDLLAAPADLVASEGERIDPDGVYPTAYLRVLLMIEVVRKRDGAAVAAELLRLWVETYGKKHALSRYGGDIENIVKQFAFTAFAELGRKSLHALLPVTEEAARDRAKEADGPGEINNANVRVLFAAIRYAFDDHDAKSKLDPVERLRAHIVATRSAGVRSRAQDEYQLAAIDERDQKQGAQLVELFASLRTPPADS
jgi:hypothetical protein